MLRYKLFPLLVALACSVGFASTPIDAQTIVITVHADQKGTAVSPDLYGLMTEEINHSYDGGLYAELIQNRIFKDDSNAPVHWSVVQDGGGTGSIALDNNDPIVNTALTTCIKLTISAAGAGQQVGVANDGFWGIPVRPNTTYKASFFAKAEDGFTGPLTLSVRSSDGGKILASGQVPQISGDWKQYAMTFTTGDITSSANNTFVITGSHVGAVLFNLVSLFPPTYDNTPNGNRIDLMEKLAAMHPAFLRLPGGNYVEGISIPDRFDWKKTIGPLDQRPGNPGTWGYRSSQGLGLLEYMEWCQDLHMQPVLAVWAGFALNRKHVKPGPDLAPYVQDALEEIEYVTGDVHTKWGAERAKDGHSAPFPLHYVEIGNEDFVDKSGSYDGRFAQFYKAIKAKYPKLQLIATAGVKSVTPDISDEHYYQSAAAMEAHAHQYDSYPRTGPKIFVGEWASIEGSPTPDMNAALGDAAWLTGIERNSDKVIMESYAPLLVNVNPKASVWVTNLIGYDALSSFGSPSYYVQCLFSANHGDQELPVDADAAQVLNCQLPKYLPNGGVGVGTWATQAQFKDLTVTHAGTTLYQSNFAKGTSGVKETAGSWSVQDGALTQTSGATGCLALMGDPKWTDYTYELKAQKLSGKEGFLIPFHAKDDQNLLWWNIGGWGDTHTAIERTTNGDKVQIGPDENVTVETGHWYDIKIDVQGTAIRCYLNGKLIEQETDTPPAPHLNVFTSASRDTKTGNILLHLVNAQGTAQPVTIDLMGITHVAKVATGEMLSGDPKAENSIQNPTNIAPTPVTILDATPQFSYTLSADSVSVLRFKTK